MQDGANGNNGGVLYQNEPDIGVRGRGPGGGARTSENVGVDRTSHHQVIIHGALDTAADRAAHRQIDYFQRSTETT